MAIYNFEKCGLLIERFKNQLGLSTKELANLMGVSVPTVWNWQQGQGMKPNTLAKLAKLFNITLDELLSGELKHKNNKEYFDSKYNFTHFEYGETIDKNNLYDAKMYFSLINNCNKTFFKHVIRWATDELNSEELEEFLYVKRYFKFNDLFFNDINEEIKLIDINESKTKEELEKQFILFFIKYFNDKGEKNLMWEIHKMYYIQHRSSIKAIIDSKSLIVLELYLSTLDQIHKDIFISKYFDKIKKHNIRFRYISNEKTDPDYFELRNFENDPLLKTMLDNNCRFIHRRSEQMLPELWDEEVKCIEGNLKPIYDNLSKIKTLYKNIDDNGVGVPDYDLHRFIYNSLNFNTYQLLVDQEKTKFYIALTNYKKSEPLKYYEMIKEISYSPVIL